MSSSKNTSHEITTLQSKGLRDVWYSKGGTQARLVISAMIYRMYRLLGELTAVLLGLGIILAWTASSVLGRQSTELTVLRPNIKIWFADAFDGKGAEFERLDLAWLPVDNHIVMTLEKASILNENDEILESFDLITTTFAIKKGDVFNPSVVSAQVKGGVISYIEDEEGIITIGLGPPDAVGRVGPVYRSNVAAKIDTKIPLQDFELIQIENAKVHYVNNVSGINLLTDIDLLRASFSGNGVFTLSANGGVKQFKESAPFTLETIAQTDLSELKLKTDIKGARLDQIGPVKGRFSALRGLAAPVNLSANIDFSKSEGLQSAYVDLGVADGQFTNFKNIPASVHIINELKAVGTLDPGAERMKIENLQLRSPKLSFKSSGFLTELGNLSDGDDNSSPVFDLAFGDVEFDITPTFIKPFKLDRLNLRGQADVDSRVLNIRKGEVTFFDTVHQFSGQMALYDDNSVKDLQLKTRMSFGSIHPQDFITLWPVDLIVGARNWLERSILDGNIDKFETDVSFDEAFFKDRRLTADRLKVRFGGRDVRVNYVSTMPDATDVSGEGFISGNMLGLDWNGGRLEGVTLLGGHVEIPQLIPRGGDLIVTAKGTGDIVDLIKIADNAPLNIATRYGIDPQLMAGSGNIDLRVTRPLLVDFPPERITYQINGDFKNAKAPFALGRFDVDNGDFKLDVNRNQMLLSGPVDIGPWRADMKWSETFGANAPLAKYRISGPITAAELDGIGVASRGWFDGVAEVTIDAEGRGVDVSTATLDVDLTETALSLERIWSKPIGVPAQLVGDMKIDNNDGFVIDVTDLSSEGVSVKGRIELESDYRLKLLNLDELRIEGLIDSTLEILPDRIRGQLNVDLKGRLLNVSPWTQDLFEDRETTLDVPLKLQGSIETLVLDPDYIVTNAEMFFSHTGVVVEGARLEASVDGKPLNIEILTKPDFTRQMDAVVPNASDAIFAFLGLETTSGGELRLKAVLPPAGEIGAFVGEAQMRNFRMVKAPAMAQLLSLASLTGLADTLSGGSMQFDRFKIPFTILGDEIAIRDARLYGPALGMTGDGDIDLKLRVLDFDGTIVPSYTANSILGDIPILGDIFVQEKDGGLFALTYTVSGPFEQTKIAVNPLSALTPGFLRRIFKRDRSKVDEDLRQKIEEVAPKRQVEDVPEP